MSSLCNTLLLENPDVFWLPLAVLSMQNSGSQPLVFHLHAFVNLVILFLVAITSFQCGQLLGNDQNPVW